MLKLIKDLSAKELVVLAYGNVVHKWCEFRVDHFIFELGEGNTFQDWCLFHLHGNMKIGSGNNFAHRVLVHGTFIAKIGNFLGFNSECHNTQIGSHNYIGHKATIYDTILGDKNVIRGDSTLRSCKIGNNVYIGPNCELTGVEIEDGAIVLRGTVIAAPTGKRILVGKDAIIGDYCTIMKSIPSGFCIELMSEIKPSTEIINGSIEFDCGEIREIAADRSRKCFDFIEEVWNHNMELAVEKGKLIHQEYERLKEKLDF